VKLTVLGGSAAGPNTGAGCAGFLITEGDTAIVIDLGPGTLLELRKHVDFRTLDAIVISHYHLDHILDLGAFRYLAMYDPDPLVGKIPLYVPPGTLKRFVKWTAAFGDDEDDSFLEDVFNIAEYDHDQRLEPGSISIRFSRTFHPVPAWAMRISGQNGGEIGYTADTGPSALDSLSEFFLGVSLLISESTEPADTQDPAEQRGHLTPKEAGKLATNAGASTLILTHRWEELGLDLAATEAGSSFKGHILTARPGVSVFV
jgi:ribonuclease BN (tRNA processing enzyme)